MKSRPTLLSTTLCLVVLAGLPAVDVAAQTVTEPDAQTDDQVDAQADAQAAGDAADAPQAQDADVDAAAAGDPATGNIDGNIAQAGDDPQASPGRFIPSEELSRDLGASFPVDI